MTATTGYQEGEEINRKYREIDKNLKLKQMDEAWKLLYQAPGTENNELTEMEKLKKEIEDLKKIIELTSLRKSRKAGKKKVVEFLSDNHES